MSEPQKAAIDERAQGDISQVGKAIGLMLMGVALFSIMDVMVKWEGALYPLVQIMFFRSLFAFVPLSFFVFRGGLRTAIRTASPIGHVLRSLAGLLAMALIFYAYTRMQLIDVIAIAFSAPILVTALSAPLLGEPVGPRRWSAILVGFIGVLVILRPGPGMLESFALIPLAGTFCYAVASIYVRKLSKVDSATAIVFYFTLTCTVVSGALLPFFWVTPSLGDLLLLAGIGLVGGAAQLVKTQAFRHADVAVIMPFDYTALLWATLYGFLIWGELPEPMTVLGTAIMVASGLYILFREAALGLPRGVARRLHPKR